MIPITQLRDRPLCAELAPTATYVIGQWISEQGSNGAGLGFWCWRRTWLP
ncbi:hypothetical protein [Streptomyces bacillaris]